MMKKNGLYIMFAIAALLVPMAYASAIVDFGGRITSFVPCTCSPYARITFISSRGVTTGTPITVDYLYGSQIFSKYNLPISRQVIGKFAPVPACLDYIGTACKPRVSPPAIGTITPYVGSSL